MYFIKHGESRNQLPSVEMFPAQNVNEIYGCCMSIVVVNKSGSCTLYVVKMISSSNVVRVPCFCFVLKLWPLLGLDKIYFSLLYNMEIDCNITVVAALGPDKLYF